MRTWQLRQATRDDLEKVLDILSMRVSWLRASGNDQWSTFKAWPPKLAEAVTHGQTWVLETTERDAVGTFTVSTTGDPEFWSPDELATPALYVAKLATIPPGITAPVPPAEIRGLGNLMLDWTVDFAARAHLSVIRLDVWKTAHKLHGWYDEHGWTKVRIVELPHRKSGVLFERRAERLELPNLREVPQQLTGPTAVVADD